MSRYTIDHHPNKQQIIRDIASGMYSDKTIAQRYGLNDRKAVERYRRKVLPELVRLTQYKDSEGLIAAITQNIVRVDKMLEALEKWAVDPEDQNVFAMDPRADEINVIYTVTSITDKGKMLHTRVKRNLQDVIDEHFIGTEKMGIRLETHKADQRVVLLKAMEVMGKNLQLLIDARDSLIRVNEDDSYRKGLEDLMQTIQKALKPYPEAMDALIRALSQEDENALPHAAIPAED